LALCPSFDGPEWDFLRQPMIDAYQGPLPLTTEEATQQMKDMWTRENNTRVAAWNEQLEHDQAERVEQERSAQVEDALRTQQEILPPMTVNEMPSVILLFSIISQISVALTLSTASCELYHAT
jgi:hypothetical protein